MIFGIIKEIHRYKRGAMMLNMSLWLIGMILLSFLFAFNVHSQGARRLGLNTTLRTFGEEIKLIQELGADTIRVPLQWQSVRIRPGEYDWSTVDRLLKNTQTRQIQILFTLRTIFWEKGKRQRGSTQMKPPSLDIKEWVHFVETLANRYRGQGVSYEIENQVNEEAFWKGTLEEYLELLKTGYDVIKKVDPQAKVLPSAMGCGIFRKFQLEETRSKAWKWHDRWLQAIFSTKKFDVVNVHNYYFPNDIIANGLTFRSYLEHIHELMEESKLKDLPIWITEIGYVSSLANTGGRMDHGSPGKQAEWLTQAYQQAFEFGVERIYWLLLQDRKEPYFGSMGLADEKGNPRLAWDAMYQLIKAKEEK